MRYEKLTKLEKRILDVLERAGLTDWMKQKFLDRVKTTIDFGKMSDIEENENIAFVDIETTGLNIVKDKIIAIGIATNMQDIQRVYGEEKEVLQKFWEFVEKKEITTLVGFNIWKFDWNMIRLKSAKYRLYKKKLNVIEMRKVLNLKTLNQAEGTLKDYCKLFEVDVKEDDIDGKDVKEASREEIEKHLKRDVERVIKLYEVAEERGLLEMV